MMGMLDIISMPDAVGVSDIISMPDAVGVLDIISMPDDMGVGHYKYVRLYECRTL